MHLVSHTVLTGDYLLVHKHSGWVSLAQRVRFAKEKARQILDDGVIGVPSGSWTYLITLVKKRKCSIGFYVVY